MAKALFGHVVGTDLRLVDEVSRLRARVSDLKSQVQALQAENDALSASIHHDDLITLALDENRPAFAGSGA